MSYRKPGSPEWKAHARALLEAEQTQPESWWYLSFATPDAFLGGVVVRARGFTSAITTTIELGINPGGEVRGYPGPVVGTAPPPPYPENKLLSRAEMEAIDRGSMN
jgi:hypothetical protein